MIGETCDAIRPSLQIEMAVIAREVRGVGGVEIEADREMRIFFRDFRPNLAS